VPSVVIRACFPVALLASIGGCATKAPPAVRAKPLVAPTTKADVWKQVASQPDADRIAQIGTAWSEALADARVHGQGDEVRHEGRLLVASAALARPAPTPGSYSCRLVEVGSTNRKKAAFERFKPFFCYVEVEGDLLTIVKQTGSQRPAGRGKMMLPRGWSIWAVLRWAMRSSPRPMARTRHATWRGSWNASHRSCGGSSSPIHEAAPGLRCSN
jgi:hypothetical protein